MPVVPHAHTTSHQVIHTHVDSIGATAAAATTAASASAPKMPVALHAHLYTPPPPPHPSNHHHHSRPYLRMSIPPVPRPPPQRCRHRTHHSHVRNGAKPSYTKISNWTYQSSSKSSMHLALCDHTKVCIRNHPGSSLMPWFMGK